MFGLYNMLFMCYLSMMHGYGLETYRIEVLLIVVVCNKYDLHVVFYFAIILSRM